ncbi:unnamed protein product [Phytophthora fragariaefolia]|uniref:Unnamed protein product n=1 Tax=Phytophthora fragariaefolia TaxID=1490495 RepID=A0A9W7CYF6_9STRA|nr:unnamed protein product [Phytophthora fragariaefolia]
MGRFLKKPPPFWASWIMYATPSGELLAMSEEASLALVELLRQRNQTLDQQIRDVGSRNKRLEEQLGHASRDSARARRGLQRQIQEAQDALRLRNEDVRRLQRQLSETVDALRAERNRAEKHRRLVDAKEDPSWMELALREVEPQQEKEPGSDALSCGGSGREDQGSPEDADKENQERLPRQSWLRPEKDVAVTLAEIIPQMGGSPGDQEKQSGDGDPWYLSTEQPVETETYAGQVTRPDLTQMLEEARDALNAHQEDRQRELMEREKVLTCPLSHELFHEPVVTECCGKTASWEYLRRAFSQTSMCPFCNAKEDWVHRNSDMATLVELHRSERSALRGFAITTTRTAANLTAHIRLSVNSSLREYPARHRERRSERTISRPTVAKRIRRSDWHSSSTTSAEDITDAGNGDLQQLDSDSGQFYVAEASPTAGESDVPNILPSTVFRPLASVDARRSCRYLFEPTTTQHAILKSLENYHPDVALCRSQSLVSSEREAARSTSSHGS